MKKFSRLLKGLVNKLRHGCFESFCFQTSTHDALLVVEYIRRGLHDIVAPTSPKSSPYLLKPDDAIVARAQSWQAQWAK